MALSSADRAFSMFFVAEDISRRSCLCSSVQAFIADRSSEHRSRDSLQKIGHVTSHDTIHAEASCIAK